MRPFASLLGHGEAVPPDGMFDALVQLAEDLAAVRDLLADPSTASVRLVLTPEAVVTAEARRTFTALALYGYPVDGVVANRIFPDGGDEWRRSWAQAQRTQLAAIRESFAGLDVAQLTYRSAEPVGADALRAIAEELYGRLPGVDPAAPVRTGQLPTVESEADGFLLRLPLPLTERGAVDAARVGDDLVVTVGGHRRVLALPSVLRRCTVAGGNYDGASLRIRFRPDPAQWPRDLPRPRGSRPRPGPGRPTRTDPGGRRD
jgi:arsenite-transporting ATPase